MQTDAQHKIIQNGRCDQTTVPPRTYIKTMVFNPWAHLGGDAVPAPAPAASVSFSPIVQDDEDADLQRALAMSMHTHTHTTAVDDQTMSSTAAVVQAAAEETREASSSSNTAMEYERVISNNSDNNTSAAALSNYDTSCVNNKSDEEFNCIPFHKLMWDDNISTINDKERWIYESIMYRTVGISC